MCLGHIKISVDAFAYSHHMICITILCNPQLHIISLLGGLNRRPIFRKIGSLIFYSIFRFLLNYKKTQMIYRIIISYIDRVYPSLNIVYGISKGPIPKKNAPSIQWYGTFICFQLDEYREFKGNTLCINISHLDIYIDIGIHIDLVNSSRN